MTRVEIMAELDELGIEYDAAANKPELEALLPSAEVEDVAETPEEATEEVVEEVEELEVEVLEAGEHTMVRNVKHDGRHYPLGKVVKLSAADTALFQSKGFIE